MIGETTRLGDPVLRAAPPGALLPWPSLGYASLMRLTAAQLARLQADGFLALRTLFSRAEVDALRAELPRLFAEDTPANIR